MIARVLAAVALVGGGLAVAPAQAVPNPNEPASATVTQGEARMVAKYVVEEFVEAMPRPRRYAIQRCTGTAKVKRCPVRWSAPDYRCTASLWVWEEAGVTYYFEWHRLRCS